ncbi:tetratricopeptide repeat protein [Saccharopolyspora sp. TS4A08]|uniref:Tetratricopeptide repeat protein n=1 Tax=Saccharopolyspora ipomoeae TaxID=3042027 RepID=A0ABT6PGS2_9PSEU|nr:tetratricopeptide repeat protein [Saccharopolyspora sp. TS4A08]MDI2027129.1 tetratricopeptide repeat protein [Saccharopolyspora sp. TS4A08]
MREQDGDNPRNDLSGAANEVVQAGNVSGGIHFHGWGPAEEGVPRQLPADARGFVNRRDELRRLDVIIENASGSHAPCVLVGTAGVGKTSLAVHWAHRVAHRFPDGQLYVNLHGYDPGPPVTPSEVLGRFLRTLGAAPESIPSDVESRSALYRSLLAGRRMLIVLDNAATVSQVRPLLPGTGACLVLVTSRSRLSGLVARDGAYRVALDVLPQDEAVDLLRVLADGHRLQDDSGELVELARLCARLPLALRIAAERAVSRPSMPLRDLIAELRDESALWDALTAGDDDESDAVRTVFAWSYRALSPETGRLFRLLGLHPGRVFGAGAAAALADLPLNRTRRLLDDLVGAHLLEHPDPDRYRFHDLLRAYATDQARAEETAETARAALRRTLVWYLRAADRAVAVVAPVFRRPELPDEGESELPVFDTHAEAIDWFERERDNLVDATRVADEAAMPELAWRLAELLRAVFALRNRFDDWFETSRIGLGAARQLQDRHAEAGMLESLGKAHTQSAQFAEGIRYQTAALEIRRELGDRRGELNSTNAIAMAHFRGRDLDRAATGFERAREIARELDDEHWIAISTNNIGNVHLGLENFEEAGELLREALEIYRRRGDHGGEGDALRGLSCAHRGAGRPGAAREHAEAAVAIAHRCENQAWEAFWLLELGRAQVGLGSLSEALESYQRAASKQRRLGDRAREAEALDATGEVYALLERSEEAMSFYKLALTAFRELGDEWRTALVLDHLGDALSATGALAEARTHRSEAVGLLGSFTDPPARRMLARLRAAIS